jgi:AbrB family looped-hinge helix DNA binding protein
MAIVQISSKGQILIPGKIRKRMGLNPGASVQLLEIRPPGAETDSC